MGVGRVGAATAFALVLKGLAERLVLVGQDERVTLGEAYDLSHAGAFVRAMDVLAGDIDDTAGADIVIVAASAPYRGAPDRLSLAGANAAVFRQIIPPIARASPNAVLIVVTNPVDVMTYVAWRLSGFPPGRVLGTGTLIDTGRFRMLLSAWSGIHTHDLRAYILGEHGDSQFPAMSVASFGGVRVDENDRQVLDMAEQARTAGHRVIEQKGYTNFAIATATAMIVEAIAANSRVVLPVSTLMDGVLGLRDVCLSMPCVVGRGGVHRVLPVDLNGHEAELLRRSAGVLRAVLQGLDPAPAA